MSDLMERIRRTAGPHPLRLVTMNLLAPGLWATAMVVGWRLAPTNHDAYVNTLLSLFATAGGSIAGYLASPYSEFQHDRFASVGKTVSALFSGYFLAKIDKFVTALLDPDKLATGIGRERILLVVTIAAVSALIVFNNRLYFSEQAEERSKPPEAPQQAVSRASS